MPDATPIRIINAEELKNPHTCTSQEILTDIRIQVATTGQELIGVNATLQELSARFEEQNRYLMDFIREQNETMNRIQEAAKGHNCRYEDQIKQIAEAVNSLKHEQAKQSGEQKWTDRIYSILQAVIIAAVVAVVLFLMKGGSIN